MPTVERTQISVTIGQLQALRKLSEKTGESMAEIVRRGIDRILKESGQPDLEEQRRRALAAAGRFRSGKKDISVNHDKYLAEIYGK